MLFHHTACTCDIFPRATAHLSQQKKKKKKKSARVANSIQLRFLNERRRSRGGTRKCLGIFKDESGPADAKRNCALKTPQAKDNNNPSNVLARAVRVTPISHTTQFRTFWPRALLKVLSLCLTIFLHRSSRPSNNQQQLNSAQSFPSIVFPALSLSYSPPPER